MSSNHSESPVTLLGLTIWFIAALFFLYEFFLRTFVGTIAPEIMIELKINVELFSLIGSAYYVAYSIMQVPVGMLADRFGVKRIMVFATLTCALSTFLFSYSSGFYSAFYSRLLMGFGSSFAFVCLLVIAATWFPPRAFGFFAGLSQFIGTMGPLIGAGPLAVVLSKSDYSWRTLFTFISIFGIILAALVLFIFRNKPRARYHAIILQPPLSLFTRLSKLTKNRQAWLVSIYSACVYASMALLGAIWGTDYLEHQGLPKTAAASIISIAWFAYAIACPLLGALSDLAKRRKPTLIACSAIGLIATAGVTFLPNQPSWIYTLLFAGLGIAASGQNIGFATIAEKVDHSTKAASLGLNNCLITLFAALIPPFATLFIYHAAGKHGGDLTSNDFNTGFIIMPILYVVGILLSVFFIKETFCKPQKDPIKLVME